MGIKGNNYLLHFIGTNNTGKSSVARFLAEKYKAENPANKIIAFDPQESFKEIRDKEIAYEDDEWPRKLVEQVRNSLVILDDYRMLHKNNHIDRNFDVFLNRRTKDNNDIILICHAPEKVLQGVTPFVNNYYIFKTMATDQGFDRKIPQASICEFAKDIVNEYTSKYGLGNYKDFSFRYVSVDYNSKLVPVSMDIDKVKEISKKLLEYNDY